jgi:hypothetical protein
MSEISYMHIGLHVKYLFVLSDSNETCISWRVFFLNNQIYNSMKIRSVGAMLRHTGGQTYKMKLTAAFSNFVNVPKN